MVKPAAAPTKKGGKTAAPGSKRHAKDKNLTRPNIESGVTKPGVRRLIKQAGAYRMSIPELTDDARVIIRDYLLKVLSVANCYRGDRKTLKVSDLVEAYIYIGHPVYGHNDKK